jgi:hypothetical protein
MTPLTTLLTLRLTHSSTDTGVPIHFKIEEADNQTTASKAIKESIEAGTMQDPVK